jgi:hypothetical protein
MTTKGRRKERDEKNLKFYSNSIVVLKNIIWKRGACNNRKRNGEEMVHYLHSFLTPHRKKILFFLLSREERKI